MSTKGLAQFSHSLLCVAFCAAVQSLQAATINGVISGTLTRAESPYLVTADTYVVSGQTLTIEPGVIIQFQNVDHALVVDGTLIARGTMANPILFTSDEASKEPGQWEAIIFRGANTNSVMENCTVECGAAKGFADECIRLEGASPSLLNCTIANSRVHGMTLLASDARIENCRFTNNGAANNGYALAMRADSLPRLQDNSATGNGHNAIGIFGSSVSRSGTWMKDNIPYTLVDDTYINANQTLTIEPGAIVQFQDPDDALLVDGTLIARGSAGSPIWFTSDKTDKQPGQWEAIIFRGTANTNSVMENCVVECAASKGYSDESIRMEGASISLSNCTITKSRIHGLTLLASDSKIENCQFTNNGSTNNGFAIAMRTDSLPRLKNNSATGNGHDAIGIFGSSVSRTGTWVKDAIPYTIVEDTYINAGQTLTIEPGVTVQFQDPYDALLADGTLIARGTATSPIRFTSDDIVKQPGQWEAIIFRGANTNSVMENCIVEYGAASGYSDESIRFEGGFATLLNCSIANSRLHGLKLLGSDARIENCQFTNNGITNNGFAMAMRSDSFPRLKNNSATGNGHDAIGIFGSTVSRTGPWVKDGMPYTILEDTYVNAGQTLTIEPGVIVQFQDPYDALIIDGTLIARGTAATPIRFTSDDAVKEPGQWETLLFRGAANTNSIMENCVVEYGGASGYSDEAIRFEGASPTLLNCTISNSRLHGLRLAPSDAKIENCRFTNNGLTNGGFAVVMRTDSFPQISGNSASGNGHDAIGIFGSAVNRSGTWLRDGIPYTVLEDTYVYSGQTLTIAPGVIVQFQDPDDALIVDGTLVARGTESSPIRFTSDDASKKPGQWEGIIFRDSSNDANTAFEYCTVEYGGAAGEGQVQLLSASPRISHCTIQNSVTDGIYASASSSVILNNRVTGNGRDGIRTLNQSKPTINSNTISANTEFAVRNFDTSVTVDAKTNFWGDPTGPLDTFDTDGLHLTNPTGKGGKVSEFVNWGGSLAASPVEPSQIPDIELAATTIDFGSISLGQSKDLTLSVKNVGTGTLTINLINSDQSLFSVISPLAPFNVSAGSQTNVTVRFAPAAAAQQAAMLTIASNDPDEPVVKVSLTGTGTTAGSSGGSPPLIISQTGNSIRLSWPSASTGVRVEATPSLSPPIHWLPVTNTPVLLSDQKVLALQPSLFNNPIMFFRLSSGASSSQALGASMVDITATLDNFNQIDLAGTEEDFEARVTQQVATLQSQLDGLESLLDAVAAQADSALSVLSQTAVINSIGSRPRPGNLSLSTFTPADSGFVPGPLTDIINQFKQVKKTVDDLKKVKKAVKNASDIIDFLTQKKSLDELVSARSEFFKQISDIFKKMREDVEAPLGEILAGRAGGNQEDIDDFNAMLQFVSANDSRLGQLMGSPGFTINSYRNLNLTDKQKDLVAQAFRSSTLRGRLYLRDNLLGFLNTLASAGVSTYVDTIISATGGSAVKTAAEFAKKVYDFFSKDAAAPQTTLQFLSRKLFLRPDESDSEVKADLFLTAYLPDGKTRLATFLISGRNVINEKGDILLTQGLQLPALKYDVLVLPRNDPDSPFKLLPFATSIDANLKSFADLPMVYDTTQTLNPVVKQRDTSGNLQDGTLSLDQLQDLELRVEGFPQSNDGPMGAIFDTETRGDGTTRPFFLVPFLPPNLPLSLKITGAPIQDFNDSLTITQPKSEKSVTLIRKGGGTWVRQGEAEVELFTEATNSERSDPVILQVTGSQAVYPAKKVTTKSNGSVQVDNLVMTWSTPPATVTPGQTFQFEINVDPGNTPTGDIKTSQSATSFRLPNYPPLLLGYVNLNGLDDPHASVGFVGEDCNEFLTFCYNFSREPLSRTVTVNPALSGNSFYYVVVEIRVAKAGYAFDGTATAARVYWKYVPQ